MNNPTCRWPGCDASTFGRGLCNRDYLRARRLGDFSAPWETWRDGRSKPPSTCRWPNCDKSKITGRGFCGTHYHRAYRLADFDSPWVEWERLNPEHCTWPGCSLVIYARKLCVTHYNRATVVEDFTSPWVSWASRLSRACGYCGTGFAAATTAALYCSKKCARYGWAAENPERNERAARANRDKRRARLAGASVERVTADEVRLATGDICYLCGIAIDFNLKHPHPGSPSMDHVVPLSRGGSHSVDNLAMTHLRCNLRKHNNPPPVGSNSTLPTI